MSEAPAFAVRAIEPGDEAALLVAEHGATRSLSAAWGRPLPLADTDVFADFLARQTVFVATRNGAPVGYAAGRDLGPLYWLAEMAVDPAHQRQGLGRKLVRAVEGEARRLFHRALGLTTFADVPFNAPFYTRLGFVMVSHKPMDATLAERLLAECPRGAFMDERVAMVRWL